MDDADSGRPAKKAKIARDENTSPDHVKYRQPPKSNTQKVNFKRQQRRADLNHPQPETAEHRRERELFGIDEENADELSLKPLDDEKKERMRSLHMPKLFSQPSVMAGGDKGIFVTCDKGREKKCLADLADLVEDYLLQHNLIPVEQSDPNALLHARLKHQQTSRVTRDVSNEDSPVEEELVDIESSINAELSGMRSPRAGEPGSHQARSSPADRRQFQLITLDVPCVSFLRFVPTLSVYRNVNVVDLVYWICAEAVKSPGRMRSRYIKRLSPVTWLGKVLNDGLERACEEVLPPHFQTNKGKPSDEATETEISSEKPLSGLSFAIKPTIRNNTKISRDDLIKHIASKVQELGDNKHKVDLKGYEKGILVDVYRSWIGMSVVDGIETTGAHASSKDNHTDRKLGFEELKRFNLSEIYAEGLKKSG